MRMHRYRQTGTHEDEAVESSSSSSAEAGGWLQPGPGVVSIGRVNEVCGIRSIGARVQRQPKNHNARCRVKTAL